MNTYEKGDTVRASVVFTDPDDDSAVDPTAVTCNVRNPAGTTSTPAVTKDSVGHYHADISANVSGVWKYKFTGTGSNPGATPDVEFRVRASVF